MDNLKLKTQYDAHPNLFTIVASTGIMLAMYFYFIPWQDASNPWVLLFGSLAALLLKYPHELIHMRIYRWFGVGTRQSFKLLNTYCRTTSKIGWLPVLLSALSPLIVLSGAMLLLLLVVSAWIPDTFIFHTLCTTVIVSSTCYVGDIGCAWIAVKYRGCIFEDIGQTINVYKPADLLGLCD